MKHLFAVCVIILLSVTSAFAVNPDEVLDDPKLEARARAISTKLRCLVCQNQSIDDSDAELARDLRVIVRERLVEGDSNEEVMDFVVSRYGEFVLLQPRMSARNMLLWATPLIGLVLGLLAVGFLYRTRKRTPAVDRLTPEEHERISEILADGEEGGR